MIYYKDANYNLINKVVKIKKKRLYDDNIYTLDIETTSCFLNKNNVELFDYTKKPSYYEDKEKIAFMYIWQFSINDLVVYGRTWNEYIEFITMLKRNIQGMMIIYVHNLSFEFQFLRNSIDDFEVFARKSHHPIVARTEKYNQEYRCSLMLTQSKLENLPKMYDLPVEKMTGDLDYNVLRTEKTLLTEKELKYCEHDCLVVYELIKKFTETYKHVCSIPLTQTGILRKECQKMYKYDKEYHKNLSYQLPKNIDEMMYIMKSFAGGYTHANHYYTGDIIKNVTSMDITSSYPTVMIAEKYPCTNFFDTHDTDIFRLDTDNYSYILDVTFKNISTVLDNTYISYSKTIEKYHCRVDNGRIVCADMLRVILTDVDLSILTDTYTFDSYIVNRCKRANKTYLDKKYIEKILTLYNNKTQFKGLNDKKNEYMQSKQFVNSLYGMMVTNLITDTVVFDNIEWNVEELTDDKANDQLQKINKNPNTFLSPTWGVFVTAYARKNLWTVIKEIDDDVIYCDTDSIKYINNHDNIFNDYNKNIIKKLETTCDFYNLDKNLLKPCDTLGIAHPLGIYDHDDSYKKFVTLGAKKYAYEHLDGNTGITVAGVGKSGIKALKSLKDFKTGLIFDYKNSGKMLLSYQDFQPDVEINGCKIHSPHSIHLMPTEYTLGLSEEYYNYLNETEHYKPFE